MKMEKLINLTKIENKNFLCLQLNVKRQYTSTSCQVPNCNGKVIEICLDHLFASQIPLTTGGFELQVSYIRSSYLSLAKWVR